MNPKLVVSALCLALAPYLAHATIYFQNPGNTSGWDQLYVEHNGSVTTVNSPTYGSETTSIQAEQIYDSSYTGRYHAEARYFQGASEGWDRYYGYALYLPSNWQFVNETFNFMQFIGTPPCSTSGGQPWTMLWIRTNSLMTRITTGPDACTRTDQNLTITSNYTSGTWHTIVLHANWESDSTGIFTLWYDGSKVIDQQGVPTCPANGITMEFAIGQYANGWHDTGTMLGTQSVRDVYEDQITIASSYAEANPAATTSFTITASAGAGGTISPSGSVSATQGSNQTFTITPNSGDVISSVTVDGTNVGAVSSYTFSNVQANHTISAAFTAITAGGTFEAESQQIVATSGDTYSTNSEAGYSNGQAIQYNSAGAGDYITFRLAGIAAGTYDVVVGYKSYTTRGIVQISAGTAGGAVTNVGSPLDEYGASSYTSADLGNWTATTTGSQDVKFTTTGRNASSTGYTMTIDYIKLTPTSGSTNFTITANAGSGGSISPSGSVSVAQGANQTFTITANAGEVISSVTVDGVNQGAVSSYTFSNVQAAHTISAAFSAATNAFTITASAGTGGSISPAGAVTVNQGTSQTFTIAANSGSSISGVTVDGTNVGAVSSYTFSNVQANHTISAAFSTTTNSNIAPSGTAYGWFGMTSSFATTNQTAQSGLNDGNLTTDVDLDSAGDAINAWEAAGVIWSSAKTITSADFINGTITSGGDGFLTANLYMQYTTDGVTWTSSGWTISPTYPYSSAAGGQTYTANGTTLTGVLGVRFVGQVRTTDTSYHWLVKEVQVIGQ